jgi:hypothetical protein
VREKLGESGSALRITLSNVSFGGDTSESRRSRSKREMDDENAETDAGKKRAREMREEKVR